MKNDYLYNTSDSIISNNIIVSSSETSNVKTASFTFSFCAAIVGITSLVNLPLNMPTGYVDTPHVAHAAYNMHSCVNESYIGLGSTIDLLKIENINKVQKIGAFEENWNGNGAKKFSERSIKLFIDIINALPKQPKIAPTGKGTLLMQYEAEDKSLLAFDVGLDRVEKVFVPKGKYECADQELFTVNIVENMCRCVEKIYEVG